MHVFVVVVIGLAVALHAQPHSCTTGYAAIGDRLQIVNSDTHARSWCTVVPGRTPMGSVIAVDAITRQELAMAEHAFVRVDKELPAPSPSRICSGPQTCMNPRFCMLALPVKVACP